MIWRLVGLWTEVAMPSTERRATDYFCTKCERVLENFNATKPGAKQDTVTGRHHPSKDYVYFIHDACKGPVNPGG